MVETLFSYWGYFCLFTVVEPNTRGWNKIREKFGNSVFHDDGQLDREKLGQIIFREPEKRRLLNSIVHPEIYRAVLWKLLILFLKGNIC